MLWSASDTGEVSEPHHGTSESFALSVAWLCCLTGKCSNSSAALLIAQKFYTTFVSTADASDEEGLEADLSFIGSHAFARMEGDVDKQRRLILQGQLSEAALQKQHQRKWEFACSCEYLC